MLQWRAALVQVAHRSLQGQLRIKARRKDNLFKLRAGKARLGGSGIATNLVSVKSHPAICPRGCLVGL